MNIPSRSSYTSNELTSRHLFVRMLGDICTTQGVPLDWSSENWVVRLQKGTQIHLIYGYTFPINTAAVAGVLRDKAATYALLAKANVPAVPHFLLRLNALRDAHTSAAALQLPSLPLVLKPNMGQSGGFDVLRCESADELTAALRDLATRHQNLAVSPYITIDREFRVVMLADKPLLVFEKIRASNEWRHNLRLGAIPHLIKNVKISDSHVVLARRAMHATSAKLAAVDIAETPDGYKIMEINGGISLASFAAHSAAYEEAARTTYATLIKTMFTTPN